MKVLFIASGNKYLGCPIVQNQAASLRKNNIEVDFCFIQDRGIIGYLKNVPKIRRQLKARHYDIIHAHYSFSAFAASLAGAHPLIVSLMGSDVKSGFIFRLLIYFFRFLFAWRETIVKSAEMKKSLRIKNLLILPNGVDTTKFFPLAKNECQKRLGWEYYKRHILFAAQPNRYEKNFTLAKKAFITLNDPNTELHVLDNILHENMNTYYNASDVVLLTSLWEGSPNVIKEAMACGRPIVTTKAGDVEYLLDSLEGHYISDFEVSDNVLKIKQAMEFENNKTLTKGPERIHELLLDSDNVAAKIIEIYRKNIDHNKLYSEKRESNIIGEKEEAEYKRCTAGIWDSSVPGIKFDTNDVSNYSRMQEALMNRYPRGEKGLQEWIFLVQKMKSDGKRKSYDCIVGISGGTDSSYLLHITHQFGLRVLAVNLDNGWSSEIAVSNIKKMCDALHFDLETYVIDYEEVKSVLRSYIFASLPWIDSPTDIAIKAALYKVASRENVKYILNGSDFWSEGKQPLAWTYSDTRQLKYLVKKFGNHKLKTFPLQPLSSWVYYGFIRRIKVIRPLYFLSYQKKDAKVLLAEKYGWMDYGSHHHENVFTKFIISYWLPVKFGIDKRIITYSAQILSGEIKRDEAIHNIGLPSYDPFCIENDINYVLKKLDLSIEDFNAAFKSKNKYFYDYPSYYPIIKRFSWFGKSITSKIFGFKPGIYEAIDQQI